MSFLQFPCFWQIYLTEVYGEWTRLETKVVSQRIWKLISYEILNSSHFLSNFTAMPTLSVRYEPLNSNSLKIRVSCSIFWSSTNVLLKYCTFRDMIVNRNWTDLLGRIIFIALTVKWNNLKHFPNKKNSLIHKMKCKDTLIVLLARKTWRNFQLFLSHCWIRQDLRNTRTKEMDASAQLRDDWLHGK